MQVRRSVFFSESKWVFFLSVFPSLVCVSNLVLCSCTGNFRDSKSIMLLIGLHRYSRNVGVVGFVGQAVSHRWVVLTGL